MKQQNVIITDTVFEYSVHKRVAVNVIVGSVAERVKALFYSNHTLTPHDIVSTSMFVTCCYIL